MKNKRHGLLVSLGINVEKNCNYLPFQIPYQHLLFLPFVRGLTVWSKIFFKLKHLLIMRSTQIPTALMVSPNVAIKC